MSDTPSAPPVDPQVEATGDVSAAGSVGLSRRAVVAGAGGVACVGLLAACGGGSTATSPGTPAVAPPAPAAPSASSGGGASSDGASSDGASSDDTLAKTSSIPVGGGAVFADQNVVVTQPTAGEFKAFSATCTHQGCKVNKVANGVIACPCHGSKFNIADGSVANGPAKKPLPEKPVSVEGGAVVLA
jgi:Rieske Fe-S protein